MKKIKFKELREYLSPIDRYSICMYEDMSYENYRCLQDIPDTYDEFYVYGIGTVETEFPVEKGEVLSPNQRMLGDGLCMVHCIDIVLSKAPRKVKGGKK